MTRNVGSPNKGLLTSFTVLPSIYQSLLDKFLNRICSHCTYDSDVVLQCIPKATIGARPFRLEGDVSESFLHRFCS